MFDNGYTNRVAQVAPCHPTACVFVKNFSKQTSIFFIVDISVDIIFGNLQKSQASKDDEEEEAGMQVYIHVH